MITIDVKSNIDQAMSKFVLATKAQASYAARKAVTKTAEDVRKAEIQEMRDVFDKPTPYTLAGVENRLIKRDPPTARINLKDFSGKGIPASKFLRSQITGGSRRLKRFEKALVNAGVLPEGMVAVPGQGAQMDSYGNMKPSQIVQILSYFRAFPETGYRANITEAGKARLRKGTKKKQGISYFVGRPGNGKLPLGVWQKVYFGVGVAIKPVLIFVDSPLYEAIYNFDMVARLTLDKVFDWHFTAAFNEAKARGV